MKRSGAERIMRYYKAIPEMLRLLEREKAELEAEYSGLRATAFDGMPHGSTPGMPTETLAIQADGKGVQKRLKEIGVRVSVLETDAVAIRGCLDALSGRYKGLLFARCLRRYSWAKISVQMGVPDSTVRYWYKRALDQLGKVLDDVPMAEELEGRASRAYSL